jgi:hypothetical protein
MCSRLLLILMNSLLELASSNGLCEMNMLPSFRLRLMQLMLSFIGPPRSRTKAKHLQFVLLSPWLPKMGKMALEHLRGLILLWLQMVQVFNIHL